MTTVLGFVAYRVTSKNDGIGMCEWNWRDAKEIKSGKRSGFSGDSTEKRALIYTTARVKKARLMTLARENKKEDNVEFEDQDLDLDKDLEKMGVVMQDLIFKILALQGLPALSVVQEVPFALAPEAVERPYHADRALELGVG